MADWQNEDFTETAIRFLGLLRNYYDRKNDNRMERKRKIENGHIIVKNPLARALPVVRVTLQSGETTYRFTGSYDGLHSVPAKVLRLMEKDGDKGDEKSGKA